MRELVYRSDRKLRQEFDHGSNPGLFSRAKAIIKMPFGFGEIAVEAAGRHQGVPKIDTVLAKLRDDRAPVRFTDPVQPGQWVQFDAPMSYTVIDATAVFLDIDEPSPLYPSGGDIRLLLHGSAEHMVGAAQPPRSSVDELSTLAATHSPIGLYAEAYASVFNHFVRLIAYAARQDIDRVIDSVEENRGWSFNKHISAAGLDHVLPTVSRYLHLPHTAEWLAGCARVTAVVPSAAGHRTILFATPLYVERVAPPDPDMRS